MTKPLFDVFRDAMLANPKGSRKEAMDRFVAAMKSEPVYIDMLARDYFERMSANYIVREEKLGHSFGRTDAAESKCEKISAALVGRNTVKAEQPVVPFCPKLSPEEREAQRAAAQAEGKAIYEAMVAQIRDVILLDIVMPDGKRLRESTGADCAKAGGFFAEVGKRIKPTQVVDKHLTENDLKNIRARYFIANAA